MVSRAVKILSAAAIAAALVGTVAVSRTVHTRKDVANVQPAHDSGLGVAPGAMTRSPLHGHGNIACGMLSYSDCETLKMTLPM
jgi:hypothetical protein